MTLHQLSIIFLILSFIIYGTSCFSTEFMRAEFERYKLPKLRVLTGASQIILALMLAIGLALEIKFLIAISLLGLLVMMFVAILVRIKIKDPISKIIPAVFYLGLILTTILLSLRIHL